MTKKTQIIGYKDYKDEVGNIVKIPIVLCTHRTDNFPEGLQFYCDFCKKNHLHGEGEGHRVAHCHNENSPFEKTGYILQKTKK